ncbi:MAG: hypothetical protein ABFS12_14135 [Bacteroidota bacterium]
MTRPSLELLVGPHPGLVRKGGGCYADLVGGLKGPMMLFCHACVTDQDWGWGNPLIVKRLCNNVSFVFRMKH